VSAVLEPGSVTAPGVQASSPLEYPHSALLLALPHAPKPCSYLHDSRIGVYRVQERNGTRVRLQLQDLGSDHTFMAVCTSSEVELLKLRQLTVERTAEFKIHKHRQQDQRDYG
jgi:hypothetical protein